MAKWVPARYGESWTMSLSSALQIFVTREIGTKGGPPPPYKAGAFGAVLKARYEDADAAKAAAIAFAGRQLRVALAAIN